jgi:poly(3-hydroxyalkanoate) synthetase
MKDLPEWEVVAETRDTLGVLMSTTERMKLSGGWLYRCRGPEGHLALVFVPEHRRASCQYTNTSARNVDW